MLPRKNRINRKDFPSYNMKGFRVFSPLFTVVFYRKDGVNPKISRASVVVSKKTSKNAVIRNNIRRRFYDSVRVFLVKQNFSFDAIFYPKPEVIGVNSSIIKQEIEKAFRQAKML